MSRRTSLSPAIKKFASTVPEFVIVNHSFPDQLVAALVSDFAQIVHDHFAHVTITTMTEDAWEAGEASEGTSERAEGDLKMEQWQRIEWGLVRRIGARLAANGYADLIRKSIEEALAE